MPDKAVLEPSKKDYAAALKKKAADHASKMVKGFKAVTPENSEIEPTRNDSRLYFPDFRVKLKDIPIAEKWSVGERYILKLVVEQSALENRKGQDPTVTFTVLGVKPGGRAKSGGESDGDNEENDKS